MTRFDTCLGFVLAREGGFVDDPADAGGPTNFGITQRTYDDYRQKRGLATQPVSNVHPMNEVPDIYRENYWLAGKCDQLPEPLDLLHFDATVNVGMGTANRMLQTALNVGIIDGIIGHRTLNAAKIADPLVIAARYCNLRITRYIVSSASKPQQRKFFRGWLHRVGDLLKAL